MEPGRKMRNTGKREMEERDGREREREKERET